MSCERYSCSKFRIHPVSPFLGTVALELVLFSLDDESHLDFARLDHPRGDLARTDSCSWMCLCLLYPVFFFPAPYSTSLLCGLTLPHWCDECCDIADVSVDKKRMLMDGLDSSFVQWSFCAIVASVSSSCSSCLAGHLNFSVVATFLL